MYGDINGGRTQRRVIGSTDFYKHVPKEMTEATKIGVVMSSFSIILMIILFFCETWAFARTKIVSSIEIDSNPEKTIALNFNISLYDLHCDFISVDVWDKLGTDRQNVTKDVFKWNLDSNGEIKKFHGRNREEREIQHEQHHESIHQHLAETEAHAVALSSENMKDFLNRYQNTIVDYYAPWCIWCQRLSPTWELFARKVREEEINLGVGKVDCVAHAQLCTDERILAFPTLRWYTGDKVVMPDYKGDRTVDAFLEYAKTRAGKGERQLKIENDEENHSGCMVAGYIMINRVPGNFHIQAKGIHHELHSAITNLTHTVNDLSFGVKGETPGRILQNNPIFRSVPEKYKRYTNPLRDKLYATYEFHQAFHHSLKVVSTHIDSPGGFFAKESVMYQILEQSQLVYYTPVNIPEIKFSYDLSPMGVIITKEGRHWYQYATTLLAIIGGTYTTLGLINATLLRIFKPKTL